MAKKAEQNKVCDKTGLTLEKNTVYDDNLLPSIVSYFLKAKNKEVK